MQNKPMNEKATENKTEQDKNTNELTDKELDDVAGGFLLKHSTRTKSTGAPKPPVKIDTGEI